jgi:hypothetical protein
MLRHPTDVDDILAAKVTGKALSRVTIDPFSFFNSTSSPKKQGMTTT